MKIDKNTTMKDMLRISLPKLSEEALTTVRSFHISGTEWQKYLDWRKEHNKTCSISPQRQDEAFEKEGKFLTGAIGGGETFSFSPNGIGVATSVRCDACNEEADITDYDLW